MDKPKDFEYEEAWARAHAEKPARDAISDLRKIGTLDQGIEVALAREAAMKGDQAAVPVIKERELEEKYQKAILNLETKVNAAKQKGDKELKVAHFSGYGQNRAVSRELLDMIGDSGNLFCAWRDKKITEDDVKKFMEGNLKRVYEYCENAGYKVKIVYWTDGIGDEGFEVAIDL